MSKGKRYDGKQKLNLKKVFGVLVALAVIIMIIFSIANILNKSKNVTNQVKSNYFTVYSNNKFGIIDNDGKIIIESIYDEMIVVPNKEKPIFICSYDINDTDGTYKTKAINEKNEQIFKEYEKIEAIDNFDSKQNIWYEDNVLRVVNNGKYGLINFNGEVILPCEYTEITALKGVKNNILVKKDDKVGLVNEKGQVIIPTEYKNILTMQEEYKNEYIIVNSENKYGVISTSGKVIIEAKYDTVKYLNTTTLYAVKENNVLKLINSDGQVLLETGYDDIIQAKGENVVILKAGKYGVINLTGVEKIPAVYEELKSSGSIYYIAKKER